MRPVVEHSINRVLACGRMVMGYATFECSNQQCSHSKKICFSCKCRLCNTCGKKLTDQWIENQKALLPDTEWQHITFTMPGELWVFFLFNRKLLSKLSPIAANAIQAFAKNKGVLPGIFTALHTFGRDLKWNVHVHLSVTRGGLYDDNTQWKSLYFPKAAIMEQWRYGVTDLLRQAYKEKKLIIPTGLEDECHNLSSFNRFLDRHYQKHWIVHFAQATKTPKATISYLGRYLKRPPIAMSRLKHYDGNSVAFEYLDHKTKTYRTFTCEAEDFLERLTQHIPDKGFQMIRYYGFLANRVRGKHLPVVYNLLNQPERNAINITFPDLLKKTFGLDPLKCILCNSQMLFAGITRGKPQWELNKYAKELALAKPIP
ncbi:MAG: IS91 family transposase [Candidatus Thiodiazotropha taylori]|nr:IS91 family transposase [Candidatus Thiodiazotropha taylori]MCG8093820.1 IS91 family transposase [Candidatus Thiodiazotropha endolucinida]MCG7953106.1 IS91 family transposase [Candidatus Thiodiazotropha taylori]MCG8032380.1 IS91 family transposase [Candidatus Thiodiazotropha taylori]MCG8078716.1 IS91 family transposase [Candidatus Thiodiazotropha taylori]